MRLFIGIFASSEIKNYLSQIQNFLTEGKIKLVPKRQIHITLKFLGDISKSGLKEVKQKLNEIKFRNFELTLNKIGVFPSEDYIKVVWCGVEEDPELTRLQSEVEKKLEDLKFKKDHSFHAHLTLGRVRFIKNKKEFIKNMDNIKIKPFKFKVNNFQLLESKLGQKGPEYKTLEEYNAN